MQYFIYGNPISIYSQGILGGKYPFWERRDFISGKEIIELYPKSETVKLFKKEEDVLNYCNSLWQIDNQNNFPTYYLRPIYIVECEEINVDGWNKTEIDFTIVEFTPLEHPNKNTHHKEKVPKKCTVEIADVQLFSLKPIKGTLKEYYDEPHKQRIKGSVDFQSSNAWQCSIL